MPRLFRSRDGVQYAAGDDSGAVVIHLLQPELVFMTALKESDELRQRELPEFLFPQPQRLPPDRPEL